MSCSRPPLAWSGEREFSDSTKLQLLRETLAHFRSPVTVVPEPGAPPCVGDGNWGATGGLRKVRGWQTLSVKPDSERRDFAGPVVSVAIPLHSERSWEGSHRPDSWLGCSPGKDVFTEEAAGSGWLWPRAEGAPCPRTPVGRGRAAQSPGVGGRWPSPSRH